MNNNNHNQAHPIHDRLIPMDEMVEEMDDEEEELVPVPVDPFFHSWPDPSDDDKWNFWDSCAPMPKNRAYCQMRDLIVNATLLEPFARCRAIEFLYDTHFRPKLERPWTLRSIWRTVNNAASPNDKRISIANDLFTMWNGCRDRVMLAKKSEPHRPVRIDPQLLKSMVQIASAYDRLIKSINGLK